ncbi:hypothetical protein SmJEL517_g02384 [Synchytrium microbalum]|uniref:Isochorismatase-like domain-containing protein n=1 Tax=Synchytrium microbalum TaxID=1806994 RepID=A0A507C6L3_9FUNG|nr:uncharacterized protein SmJEL517_g02384 [Synchytrium microbalum]TPX35141.1 hypothetical protein SmJEL517_g02384 [Synchytrium microbalum]
MGLVHSTPDEDDDESSSDMDLDSISRLESESRHPTSSLVDEDPQPIPNITRPFTGAFAVLSEELCLMHHESFERNWKQLYIRLDSGITGWKGYALDRATNGFKPYPMEVLITESGQSSVNGIMKRDSFSGVCRWSTLRDSLTRLEGCIDSSGSASHRFKTDVWLGTSIPQLVTFSETEIIRGSEIAVPNKYEGIWCGPCIVGIYDPGIPQFLGAFAVVAEEALPISPTQSTPLRTGQLMRGLCSNTRFKGYQCELCIVSQTTHDTSSSIQISPIYSTTFYGTFRLNPIHCKTLSENVSSGLGCSVQIDLPICITSNDGGITFTSARLSKPARVPGEHKDDAERKERWCLENMPFSSIDFPILRQGNALIGFFRQPRVAVSKELQMPVIVTEQNPQGLGKTVSEIDVSFAKLNKPKSKFSMCIPEVMTYLAEYGIETVIISGLETHVCVYQTSLDLLNEGIKVVILADGVSSINKGEIPIAIEALRSMGCTVASSESIMFQLLGDASHEKFKAIQGIVKDYKDKTKLAIDSFARI